ncbi:MAG TPA: RIO1 family regulatory kinase/ATPase, partial [Streptosporangiaceae bacterium]|nr:RIO1 family regulatory kinase/ATPase [Streptosporangiaceae bacterium]
MAGSRAGGLDLPGHLPALPYPDWLVTELAAVDTELGIGTELLLEFIGSADGTAAPRLAETRPGPAELAGLWDQLVQALVGLARDGLAHGDLSAYNLLVHDGRLVMIDLPQVVDVVANPRGDFYLTRDAENVGRWFTAHGLGGADP